MMNTSLTEQAVTYHPYRYFALACDYDGTIAHSGVVPEATLSALKTARASGRRLILVTGRFVADLQRVFPEFSVFHRIVAENGAVLYRPDTHETKVLGAPPPSEFVDALRKANVVPLEVGSCIVATLVPHDETVLNVIRDLGLELKVIYNKGSVMVVPSGISKGTGLRAALAELGISPHNTVAVGDAENDHALLASCAVGVALQNAVPSLKQEADLLIAEADGRGVESLIKRMLSGDLAGLPDHRGFSSLPLGTTAQGREIAVNSFAMNLLIAGPSASGKSTIVHSLLEAMLDRDYQVFIIDPEGDYEQAQNVLSLGTSARAPDLSEISKALKSAVNSVAVNLLGLSRDERQPFFNALLARLREMRASVGRPHWIVIDEAHHLMPSSWEPGVHKPPLGGVLLVTVHPESVSSAVLNAVRGIIAVGSEPDATLRSFSTATGIPAPLLMSSQEPGTVLAWFPNDSRIPVPLRIAPPAQEIRRHRRKYALGELGPNRSFYFRGPQGKLNLQAKNFALFIQIAKGVDDATWMHHLRQHDYSRWISEAIKDEVLSSEISEIENTPLPPDQSREQIFRAIQKHYTAGETNDGV